jgi:hypothetical protein
VHLGRENRLSSLAKQSEDELRANAKAAAAARREERDLRLEEKMQASEREGKLHEAYLELTELQKKNSAVIGEVASAITKYLLWKMAH